LKGGKSEIQLRGHRDKSNYSNNAKKKKETKKKEKGNNKPNQTKKEK